MSQAILRVAKVSKAFPGVLALDQVDFELIPGEVHALVGENGAGKSTLIKLLSGVYQKDTGAFFINGNEVDINSTSKAQALGISTIYQEFNLVSELTVGQNIFLGREPRKKGVLSFVIDKRLLKRKSSEILSSLGLQISPDLLVTDLTVPQQQLVEVAKALSLNAKIFIFDEPTATLSEKEIAALFQIINMLKAKGISIIYISHRLEEIRRIADRVSVLRDGRRIGTLKVQETSTNEIIRMMVGRDLGGQFPRQFQKPGEVVLELANISSGKSLNNINLHVHRGEIVSLAGLVGSGRTGIALIIFGIDRTDSGEIRMFGRKETIDSPVTAAKLGIAFLTEDRKNFGIFPRLTVKENILISAIRNIFPSRLINANRERAIAEEYVDKLRIQVASLSQWVQYLSGGNQQKVVLARWLATQAKLLVLDEPTRGIDVGAKLEIHRLMDELAKEGVAILMISSEIPEIMGMSDRIYVVRNGEISAEYSSEEATEEKILKSAMAPVDEKQQS